MDSINILAEKSLIARRLLLTLYSDITSILPYIQIITTVKNVNNKLFLGGAIFCK